jgi:ABC-type nitrate/sulfonate/bicarbonate transport system permease component
MYLRGPAHPLSDRVTTLPQPYQASQHHAAKRRETIRKWLLRALSLTLFAFAWQWTANRIDSLLMPTFTETIRAIVELAAKPALWQALWTSNLAMILGFAASVAIGVPTGFVLGRWRIAEQIADPYLNILMVLPKSALIPLIILAIGFSLPARVLVVFLFSVVVIVVNARTGLRQLDPSWIEMARAYGASEFQLWRKILLPGAMPGVITGLRVGLGRALGGMLAVELLLVAVGIGRLLLEYQAKFEAGLVYATTFFVVVEAVLLLNLMRSLEERWAAWAGPTQAE